MNDIFFYLGGLLPLFWGTAHLFPTQSVVQGFGSITVDNQRIITMEWINEGVTLIFIGVLVIAVTWIDASSSGSRVVYWLSILALNALSGVSLFTGFRIDFLPFKLCPVIFSGASLLILLGIWL